MTGDRATTSRPDDATPPAGTSDRPHPPLAVRDQAAELRNLVLRSARQRLDQSGPSPMLITVGGGKASVGVTTVSVNLAVALAELGGRVVLVDADVACPEAARLCDVSSRMSILDLLDARRDIHEVLQRGPGGIQIVAGPPSAVAAEEVYTPSNQHRLLGHLKSLGRYADTVVLDGGSSWNAPARRFWQAATQILLVTTPDLAAVMDTYATVKTQLAGATAVSLQLVVNQADQAEAAADVHRRIDQSCQRFLGLSVGWAGHVPADAKAVEAAQQQMPLVLRSPGSPAAKALAQLAAALQSAGHAVRAAA